MSAEHFAIGIIDYGDGESGTLVYVKASMTGDEPETVRSRSSKRALDAAARRAGPI